MKRLLLLPSLILFSSSLVRSDIDRSKFMTPEEVDSLNASMIQEKGYASQIKALEEWDLRIDATKNMPPEEAIPVLAKILIKVSRYHIFQVPERFELYEKSQDLLLSLPGHARYFGDQIEKNPRHPDRANWLEYLKNLPSPETVGVLGEMLSDERGRPDPEIEELDPEYWMQSPPVCNLAAQSLQMMLENPPVPATDGFREWRGDVATWRIWYERVKAGRQTFRFRGDPVDYNLRGPSKRGEVLPTTSRTEKRVKGETEQTSAPQPPHGYASRYMPYVLGLLFLAAGLGYFLRKRNA